MRIPPSWRRRGKLSRARAAVLSVKRFAGLRQCIRCPLRRPQRRRTTGRAARPGTNHRLVAALGAASVPGHSERRMG
jgi:hypothetical protein